ncbi:site-2 protease family protein [Shimazuella kribbensis]|uniref:site-2 protease family protein n=1 Tax=Shimazuella kribbensis TaxID=139808 RepID=UPI0003FA2268|nr:site-2 protease family protein [Shimazuella kribbensis]
MDFSSFLAYPLAEIPYVVVALLLAFTVHELAHAYVAYIFGDPTAKNDGRLTLNPLKHLDPVGTLFIFLVGFGWAKPVLVNRSYFRHPRTAGIFVSLAGPVSNIILAFVFVGILKIILVLGLLAGNPIIEDIIFELIGMIVWLNIVLFLFNLLPLPPLDGYRMVENLVSPSVQEKMQQYEHYGFILFVVLWITPVGDWVISPLFHQVGPKIYQTFAGLFGISF